MKKDDTFVICFFCPTIDHYQKERRRRYRRRRRGGSQLPLAAALLLLRCSWRQRRAHMC